MKKIRSSFTSLLTSLKPNKVESTPRGRVDSYAARQIAQEQVLVKLPTRVNSQTGRVDSQKNAEAFPFRAVKSSRLLERMSRFSEKHRNFFSVGCQLESTLRMEESTLRILQKSFYTDCESKSTLRLEEPTLRIEQKIISIDQGSEPTLREEEPTLRNNRTPITENL